MSLPLFIEGFNPPIPNLSDKKTVLKVIKHLQKQLKEKDKIIKRLKKDISLYEKNYSGE